MPSAASREVVTVFLRLGLTAFGGPVAHIAAMDDEVVERRRWVTRAEFTDLLSASNVIPGPNSTELAMHLGHRRAGWPGLVLAGVCFILPTTLLVWLIAWWYVQYGHRPVVSAMLAGMQPVVLAVVAQAVWRLSRSALRAGSAKLIALASVVALLLGAHELLVLATAALAGLLLCWPRRADTGTHPIAVAVPLSATPSIGAMTLAGGAFAMSSVAPTAGALFLAFAKIGCVLFGSGYVLLAFLRAEFVQRHAWLTDAQLFDAIAIGQVTPGPLFSSATFVGFVLAGHAGAAAATAGIFLPAFCFVALSAPFVHRLRQSPRTAAMLDGVNSASLAMMITVLILLVRAMPTPVSGVVLALLAFAVLVHTRIGAGWLLLCGALIGIVQQLLVVH